VPAPIAELHVLPHARSGGWMVARSGGAAGLSWHGTAGEAELAARRHAASCIYLHDRYQRVRAIVARPDGGHSDGTMIQSAR
jgi:Uncharacterized protein conserved in bacteria (DUF2188)